MAINDVSLTAGMRANLLSLQGTVDLLNRTQNRLSTGKKVNTAMDNPVSFFAAQALTSRASFIDGLKDAMSQAVQTITAADKGITALTAMIEQAKGIAQSAQTADTDGAASVSLTPTSVAAGTPSTVNATVAASMTYGDTVLIDGITLTATSAANGDGLIHVTGTATTDALALKAAIEATTALDDYTVTVTGAVANITKDDSAGDPANMVAANVTFSAHGSSATAAGTAGDAIVIGTTTLTATFNAALAAADTSLFYVGGTDAEDATALADAINANTTLNDAGYSATVAAGKVNLAYALNDVSTDITTTIVTAPSSITKADVASTSELNEIQNQYNTLLDQMTALAGDSGYKGKNLLDAKTLTVKFEGTTLDVIGFDASATGLGLNDATWSAGASVDTTITALETAATTLRQKSSEMAGNLSIISVRQDFSKNMINTLTEGSDKLTLADTNEEGANMLMLQTRQSLGSTALSLSAQAAQSVLRLFQ